MIDEVAEVKQYLDGNRLEDGRNHYRACYMITKYYKQLGMTKKDTFDKVSQWASEHGLQPKFSLIGCVNTAYENDVALRHGGTVKISQADVDCICKYSRNRADRRVALALMCCAKSFADENGVFVASSGALGSWLGMCSPNIRQRHLRYLQDYGFVERIDTVETMHGWRKNYFRQASRLRLLVPFDKDGEWELINNDIRRLYEQAFGEPYDTRC